MFYSAWKMRSPAAERIGLMIISGFWEQSSRRPPPGFYPWIPLGEFGPQTLRAYPIPPNPGYDTARRPLSPLLRLAVDKFRNCSSVPDLEICRLFCTIHIGASKNGVSRFDSYSVSVRSFVRHALIVISRNLQVRFS